MENVEHVHTTQPKEKEATKLLGAHVEESLYWQFKRVAAARQEDLKVAVEHAARMYIDTVAKTTGG